MQAAYIQSIYRMGTVRVSSTKYACQSLSFDRAYCDCIASFSQFVSAYFSALHFAPLTSAYTEYLKTHNSQDGPVVNWATWANIHQTTVGKFAAFETLTSPKSLYKLADSKSSSPLMCQTHWVLCSMLWLTYGDGLLTCRAHHSESESFMQQANYWLHPTG